MNALKNKQQVNKSSQKKTSTLQAKHLHRSPSDLAHFSDKPLPAFVLTLIR
jgi:hypothetical protein